MHENMIYLEKGKANSWEQFRVSQFYKGMF